jgi:membrane dipeptidase
MIRSSLLAAALTLAAAGQLTAAAAPDAAALERARQLTQRIGVADTHIDVPYRLLEDPENVALRTLRGDFDAERARAGGLAWPFMSIYVASDYQKGGAKLFADTLIELVEGLEAKNPSLFAIVYSTADAAAAKAAGKIGLALGMENGAPIENDLANVQHFYDRGVRYITLTHSADNQICDSSFAPADKRTWHGVSPFGKQVIAEMNRVGIMVDLSHVSDEAFDQAILLTQAPPIASHSSVRHFTPGFERNLDDERIRKLAAKGGVVSINFGSGFLTPEGNAYLVASRAAQKEFTAAHKDATSKESRAFSEGYVKAHPVPFAALEDVVRHIEHVVKLVGIDHVGVGSDFDGVGDSLPVGLKDVSMYPNLTARLLEKGYSEEDLGKILSGNVLRVWRAVEAYAATSAKTAEKKDASR